MERRRKPPPDDSHRILHIRSRGVEDKLRDKNMLIWKPAPQAMRVGFLFTYYGGDNMNLKIDPEFESRIPPLTEEEFCQLEENILADGLVINPIITWNGVVVDGHNRFRIVESYPNIKFSTFEMDFGDRYAALAWICRNQLGRRNLSPEQKKYLMGKQYESEKAEHGGDRRSEQVKSSYQNDNLKNNIKTCERIAKENGVSPISVIRAENYAKAIDVVDDSVPGTRKRILSGELKPTEREIRVMAQAEPDLCSKMVKDLERPKNERILLTKISTDMLHAQSPGNPDTMLYEMNDALDSLIFRWSFCSQNYASFFDDEVCRGKINQIIQKGITYMKNCEGGKFTNEDDCARV